MNTIKHYLTRLAEKITGRKCSRCLHNVKGRCCHPDGRMFMRCWSSITRPGFKYSEAVQFARTCGAAVAEGFQDALAAPMTTEERELLQKIKGSLDNAETAAREAGLLED
jgi:hypothetical protein